LWYIKREQQHRKSANVLPVNELNKIISAENELSPKNSFGKILAYIVDGENLELAQKLLEAEIRKIPNLAKDSPSNNQQANQINNQTNFQ